MPNTKSAERRVRSNARKAQHNKGVKTRLKSLQRDLAALLASTKKEDAGKALRDVNSSLDKAVKSGVIRKETANRKKSRLALQLNKMK